MFFNKSLLALDIGSSAVKLIELGGVGTKTLRSLGLEVIPPQTIVNGVIQNKDEIVRAIKTLLKKLKINPLNRRVSLSLSGSSVLVKKIVMNVQKDADLSEQVFVEAEQHFQTDMAEIYFDFFELNLPPGMSLENERTVILVGAKRDMIEVLIAAVRESGLRTGVVECSAFSATNMFEYNYGVFEGLCILMDIGASTTKLSLIINGLFVDTREIPLAGDEYTKRIMDGMGIDRANAETLKIAASQGESNSPPEIPKIIGETNELMVQDVRTSVEYFLQGGDALARIGKLNQIYLTGGGARILGLDASLAATLQVPVQILNPFQKIDIDPKNFQMDYVLMQGHLYGIAVGLGLRQMSDNAA